MTSHTSPLCLFGSRHVFLSTPLQNTTSMNSLSLNVSAIWSTFCWVLICMPRYVITCKPMFWPRLIAAVNITNALNSCLGLSTLSFVSIEFRKLMKIRHYHTILNLMHSLRSEALNCIRPKVRLASLNISFSTFIFSYPYHYVTSANIC